MDSASTIADGYHSIGDGTSNIIGIIGIELAKKPFYTSKPNEDRSGMGFAVMEGFMDKLDIDSAPGKGTKVSLYKKLA